MAVFWPASGIATGALSALGPRALPALVIGVVAGALASNLVSDWGLVTSLCTGLCNIGEAVLAAWLLERWFGLPFRFGDLRRVAGFFAAVVLASAASAIVCAAIITLLHTAAPYWGVWRAWFLSVAVGNIVVTPLLISLVQVWREPPSRRIWIEGAAVLGLTTLASSYGITHNSGSWVSLAPGAFVLPLLLWLTARCPAFGIAGALVTSVVVIIATIFGIGRFGDAAMPILERVKGAQVATAIVTVYTLVLGALFAERKEAEEGLRESEQQLAKKSAALARLNEISSRLWLTCDLHQALDEILTGAIELLGAEMGIIRILDPARNVLEVQAHRGLEKAFLRCFREVSAAGDSPYGRALLSGKRMVIADVEEDRLSPFRQLAHSAGFRAVQATPIMNREGALIGTLTTYFRPVHSPSEQDLHVLDFYGRQAAGIIEHHKADAALRTSDERLRAAQLKAGIGVWDRNLVTGELTLTPELEAVFGVEPGSVKCYADFRDRVHPDDITAFEAERNAAVRRHETFSLEYRFIRPDGQVRWMLGTGGAFYDELTGEPTRLVGNDADITQRKEAGVHLALASKAARVGYFTYDFDTGLNTVSEGYAAIYGLPEGTTLTTPDKWRASVHPDDRAKLEEARRQVFECGRRDYTFDYRIIRPDGEVRWIDSRRLVSYDAIARPRRMVGINIDVTERKKLEDHKAALVSELDHRVKNVLAVVSTVASRTRETSSSMAEFVSALDGRIKSMATTHELLSDGRWQGIALAELVRHELAPYATAQNTRIDGPDVVLNAEASQTLAMVFHELATNAAKYGAISTASGRVSVRWGFRRKGRAESFLCIDWEESGGPNVVLPTRSGFGTSVVRELVPYELGGTVDLMHLPEGVCAMLEIPAQWLSAGIS